MLPHNLITILACPACKGELSQSGHGQYLLCPPCGLKYPVREGIPVLLAGEAETVTDCSTPDTLP